MRRLCSVDGMLRLSNRLVSVGCRRPIKMSLLCQLQMTLPRGFPGGVGGAGSADEGGGDIAAGSAARSGSEAVNDAGSETAAGARAPSGVPAIKGLSDRGRDGFDLEATRALQQPAQAGGAAASGPGGDSRVVLGFWADFGGREAARGSRDRARS